MAVKKNLNEKKKPIIKRNWNIRVMIEGEKTARLFAIEQKLPLPNENFDAYPVEILVKEQFTFFELMKKVVQFSKMGIYSVAYKEPR